LNGVEKRGITELARRLLPRRIKPHRILGGPLRGRYLVTSWYDYPAGIGGYTERGLLAWFRTTVKAGECWLDVGAHYGYTALALSELVGAHGRVWAFEPIAETAGHLMRTARLNELTQLSVLPIGLGEPESLSLTQSAFVRGMADSTLNLSHQSASILIARLDWLWPRLDDTSRRIHGIKIDVQGMELHVLRGMTGLLRAYRPLVVVELHAGVSRRDLLALFNDVGYCSEGLPLEPLAGEGKASYADDCSYVFSPESTDSGRVAVR
jgi:FkbM family methyltransferase